MPKPKPAAKPQQVQVRKRQDRFLAAFRLFGTIMGACRSINFSRKQVYEWRNHDEGFEQRFLDCELQVTALLEDGTMYDALGVWDEKLGRFKNGDSILKMFLLKARNPTKYRENIKLEHAGGFTIKDLCVDDPGPAPKPEGKK